jgi:hypothetical protein
VVSALTVATLVTATHFGLYGRDAVDVEIPCTHLAWQLRCMDVVAVTHPLVPDVTGGTLGVTSRLGLVVGRRVRLTRRDHGIKALLSQGFPENIAKQLDGEVMARMTLKLKDGGAFLDGAFEPQKIEFTHQPPRITSAHFLAPQPRTYRRVIPAHGQERIEAWAEDLAEKSEAPVV